jgi:hypothetical protein
MVTYNSGGYEMASKPKKFDSETVALASALLLVISEMDKVKPGFGKKIAESMEKLVKAKDSNPKADQVGARAFSTVTYGC